MSRTTISLGVILIVIGLIAYIATSFGSWTALIPAILGVIMVVLGYVATGNPRVGNTAALIVAVLGIIGTATNVFQLGDVLAGTAERPMAVITSIITFVLLIVYVVMSLSAMARTRR